MPGVPSPIHLLRWICGAYACECSSSTIPWSCGRSSESALRQAVLETAEILTAANGAEALATLEALAGRGESLSLILCDVHMPVLDGLGFLIERSRRNLLPRSPRRDDHRGLERSPPAPGRCRRCARLYRKTFHACTNPDPRNHAAVEARPRQRPRPSPGGAS